MIDNVIYIIEIIGVVSFAISGAVVAIDKEMDLFGVVFLSIITCFGGGIMRDLILGREVAFFGQLFYQHYVTVCAVTSILVFLFARFFQKWYVKEEALVMRVNNYIDAMGIGAFCISTIRICLELDPNMSAFFAISMGLIASIGGGMIRDICMNDVPFVFRKHIYAVACIAGAAFYYVFAALVFRDNEVADIIFAILGILVIFSIRVLATVFRWNFPKAIRFSRLREEQQAREAAAIAPDTSEQSAEAEEKEPAQIGRE